MTSSTQIAIYLIFLAGTFNLIAPFTKLWTFDLLNLTTTTSNSDAVDLEMHIVRLGRGRFGFAGFVDIKKDVYDDCVITVTVHRSIHKDGPYSILPYVLDNVTLDLAMNRYYKTLVMPMADKCCDNAPSFKDKFEPPLKKSCITFNTCQVTTKQLPSILMEGYYLVKLTLFHDGVWAGVNVLSYVENK